MRIKSFDELFEDKLEDWTLDIFDLLNTLGITWTQTLVKPSDIIQRGGTMENDIDLKFLQFLKSNDINCKSVYDEDTFSHRILVFDSDTENIYNLLPELPENRRKGLQKYAIKSRLVFASRSLVNVCIWNIEKLKKTKMYDFYWDLLTEQFYRIERPIISWEK